MANDRYINVEKALDMMKNGVKKRMETLLEVYKNSSSVLEAIKKASESLESAQSTKDIQKANGILEKAILNHVEREPEQNLTAETFQNDNIQNLDDATAQIEDLSVMANNTNDVSEIANIYEEARDIYQQNFNNSNTSDDASVYNEIANEHLENIADRFNTTESIARHAAEQESFETPSLAENDVVVEGIELNDIPDYTGFIEQENVSLQDVQVQPEEVQLEEVDVNGSVERLEELAHEARKANDLASVQKLYSEASKIHEKFVNEMQELDTKEAQNQIDDAKKAINDIAESAVLMSAIERTERNDLSRDAVSEFVKDVADKETVSVVNQMADDFVNSLNKEKKEETSNILDVVKQKIIIELLKVKNEDDIIKQCGISKNDKVDDMRRKLAKLSAQCHPDVLDSYLKKNLIDQNQYDKLFKLNQNINKIKKNPETLFENNKDADTQKVGLDDKTSFAGELSDFGNSKNVSDNNNLNTAGTVGFDTNEEKTDDKVSITIYNGKYVEKYLIPKGTIFNKPIEAIPVNKNGEPKKITAKTFDKWLDDYGNEMTFPVIINDDVEIHASYKFDKKKALAVGLGAAMGGLAYVADLAIPTPVPVVSSIGALGFKIGANIVNKKLANIQKLTNEARRFDAQKIQNIQEPFPELQTLLETEKSLGYWKTFLNTASIACGISAAAHGIKNTLNQKAPVIEQSNPALNNNPQSAVTSGKPVFGEFDPEFDKVYSSASNALSGTGAKSAYMPAFEGQEMYQAFFNGNRVMIQPGQSIESILQSVGASDVSEVAVNVMNSNGTPLTWQPLQALVEGVSNVR